MLGRHRRLSSEDFRLPRAVAIVGLCAPLLQDEPALLRRLLQRFAASVETTGYFLCHVAGWPERVLVNSAFP
jgi:hypothetical protein